MTLSNLIRKGGLAKVATATPATPATQETARAGTVAKVATVAVADGQNPENLAEESLPARVRQRLSAACRRLGLDPAPVLARFDRYEPYPDHEWAEMARWDGATWEAHARLLTRESAVWGTNRAAR